MKKVVIEVKKDFVENKLRVDGRTKNTGRPINKKSARQARLAKQAFYADVNAKFLSGKVFTLKNQSSKYHYTPSADGDCGALFNEIGAYECNINYIGRTKVQGFTFVLGKRVNVELNLKTLEFVK